MHAIGFLVPSMSLEKGHVGKVDESLISMPFVAEVGDSTGPHPFWLESWGALYDHRD